MSSRGDRRRRARLAARSHADHAEAIYRVRQVGTIGGPQPAEATYEYGVRIRTGEMGSIHLDASSAAPYAPPADDSRDIPAPRRAVMRVDR